MLFVSFQSAEAAEFSKFYMENVPRLVTFLVCEGVSVIDLASPKTAQRVTDALNAPEAGVRRGRAGRKAAGG